MLAIDGANSYAELRKRTEWAMKPITGKVSLSIAEKEISLDVAKELTKQFITLNQEYKNKKAPSKYAKLVGAVIDKYYKK